MSKLQELRSQIREAGKKKSSPPVNVRGSYYRAVTEQNGAMSWQPVSVDEIVAAELVEETTVASPESKYSQFLNNLMADSMIEARAQVKSSILEYLGIQQRGREVEVSSYNSDKGRTFPQLVSNYCASYFDELVKDFDAVLSKKRFREKLAEAVERMVDKQVNERLYILSREISEGVIKELREDMQKTFKPKVLDKLKNQVRADIAQRLGADEFIEEESKSEQPVQA